MISFDNLLCVLLTYMISQQNDSGCLKAINFGKHFYIFVYVLFKMKTKIETSLSIYSIHPSFPNSNIKMIEFCALKIVTSTLSKALL